MKLTKREKKDRRQFFLFILPWIVGFLVFTLIPMLMSLYYSFTDWNVLTHANWVGLGNYVEMFQDELFWQSVKVTGIYTLITVPLNVVLSLLVAILLNGDIKFAGIFRVIYYLPAILPGVVAAVLWQWIFNKQFGLLNDILRRFGVEGPGWLTDSNWTMTAMVIMSLWSVGTGIVMYLAGLQAVPQSLYETAKMDGCGFFYRLFHVTIPSMSPILLFTFINALISSFQTFTQAYVMTSGGPNNASLFYAYYMYRNAFSYRKMGKASAMGWVFFIAVGALFFLAFHLINRKVFYENERGAREI